MTSQRAVKAPFIHNFFQEYLHKFTLGHPDSISPVDRWAHMQAFHVGFAEASTFWDSIARLPKAQRDEVSRLVKDELAQFSELSRRIGQETGTGTVSTGKSLVESRPELFGGKTQ